MTYFFIILLYIAASVRITEAPVHSAHGLRDAEKEPNCPVRSLASLFDTSAVQNVDTTVQEQSCETQVEHAAVEPPSTNASMLAVDTLAYGWAESGNGTGMQFVQPDCYCSHIDLQCVGDALSIGKIDSAKWNCAVHRNLICGGEDFRNVKSAVKYVGKFLGKTISRGIRIGTLGFSGVISAGICAEACKEWYGYYHSWNLDSHMLGILKQESMMQPTPCAVLPNRAYPEQLLENAPDVAELTDEEKTTLKSRLSKAWSNDVTSCNREHTSSCFHGYKGL